MQWSKVIRMLDIARLRKIRTVRQDKKQVGKKVIKINSTSEVFSSKERSVTKIYLAYTVNSPCIW